MKDVESVRLSALECKTGVQEPVIKWKKSLDISIVDDFDVSARSKAACVGKE